MTDGITYLVLLLSQHFIEYRTSDRSEKVEKVAIFEVTEEPKSVSLFSAELWSCKQFNSTEGRLSMC